MVAYADVQAQNGGLPILTTCDVLVAGGGTAGVIAALAAARNGAKTALVEETTLLGGAMLGGAVIWMGFYNVYKHGAEPVQLVRGLGEELRARLQARGGSTGFYEEVADPLHESMGVHADRELLPLLLLEMLQEAGVALYLNTMAEDAVMDGDGIRGLIVHNKGGRAAILAKAVVDTTGSADVSLAAGAECADDEGRRSGGLAFGLAGVDFERVREYAAGRGVLSYLGYAPKGGTGKDTITRVGFRMRDMEEFKPFMEEYCMHNEPCIISNRENQATMMNGVKMFFDTTDINERNRVYIKLHESCFKMAALLRERFPGFENAYVDWVSPALAMRFVRQVVCDYDITREHIDNYEIPADTIGLYGVQDAHFLGYDIKGGYYGIPYRALLPKGVNNLLVAGKMLSSDWVVWMSTRMIGACFLQGQAVGTAAAIAAKKGIAVRNVDTDELRGTLKADGAYLG